MNIIDSVTEGILSPKRTGRIRSETESFPIGTEGKSLSIILKLPDIIDFLEDRISEEQSNPYMKNVKLQIMEQFLNQGIPSNSERRRRLP